MYSPIALLGSAYLAPISYYTKLYAYPNVCIERFDHYRKQTYRNRCVIATAHGMQVLTLPTEHGADKTLMRDIRISEHGNWRHVHWNAFSAAYRHSPFFDYYADEFHRFFEPGRYTFLFDFNLDLCRWVCEQIDLHPSFTLTDTYLATPDSFFIDFRESITPKMPAGGNDACFTPAPYYQVFKERTGFLPDLSIADLLFNMGPESLLVLRDSILPSSH